VIGFNREHPYLPESDLDDAHHPELRMTTIIQIVKS
jgi:hypothetical protein